MKNRLLLFTAILALAFGLGVYAQDAKKDDETELGGKMDKISSAWKSAKKQLPDASKNADTLAKLAAIKENMTAALKLEPALTAEKPAADRAESGTP